MRPSALSQIYPRLLALEADRGPINWIYFDTLNLATTGLGSRLDSNGRLTPYAMALPWRTRSGRYVSEAEIVDEHSRLRALDIEQQGGYAYHEHAALFLDQPVVRWDFDRKFASMLTTVKKLLPSFDGLRADAQLAIMLLVWNTGENVLNPKAAAYWQSLTVPLRAGDYLAASDHCMINGQPGKRNRWDRILLLQAARAELFGDRDRDRLFGTEVTISAAAVPNGTATKPGSHAWWTQALMHVTGDYLLPVDGLFGPKSQAAFAYATGSTKVTRSALQKLADATKSTLGVGVTD